MGLPRINPLNYGVPIEKVTEVVVLISLVGCGIKLDSPLNWKTWQPTLRLLVIVMPVGIAAMALMGHYIFGLSMAAAILLGAVLAPTDPVLAASIQVGPPNSERQEDVTRFTLTSEAGLNDGLAFPFVYLAIAIATAHSIRVLVQKIGCIGWAMMCYGESLQGWLRVTVLVNFWQTGYLPRHIPIKSSKVIWY